MPRVVGESIVLFLLPFAAYALLLIAQQRVPFVRESWSTRRFLALTTLGLAFAIVGLLGLGVMSKRYRGGYQPAHLDHGRLVPGRME